MALNNSKMEVMDSEMNPIPTTKFYSAANEMRKQIEDVENRNKDYHYMHIDLSKLKMPVTLLSLPADYEVYFKQAEAIEYIEDSKNKWKNLRVFCYQTESGYRRFLAVHPEVYWWYYSRMEKYKQCTYEVILENNPCCLYFDLEYIKDLNPNHDSIRMINTLIELVNIYMLKNFGLKTSQTDVINLDSTTDEKFSRHLIFRWHNVAFKNNIDAGRFVKGIIMKVRKFLESNDSTFHEVLSMFERSHLEELFVNTDKDKKPFIDEGVYTKNRHFRIWMSTKWGKNAHLMRSNECKYQLLKDTPNKDLGYFLESLISFFPDTSKLHLIEVDPEPTPYTQSSTRSQSSSSSNYTASKKEIVDKYIEKIVSPGGIRSSKYFADSNMIIYEIDKFYRYCGNIGRFHKSNHVYYIADLTNQIIYQKCHDHDCLNYKSEALPIPPAVFFQMDDKDDDLFFNISVDDSNNDCASSPEMSF